MSIGHGNASRVQNVSRVLKNVAKISVAIRMISS